jgi:hypothetical protein
MDTLYLTPNWDLTLDSSANIALAGRPYSSAQDAATAIRTFLGECYYNTLLGIPYFEQVLGHNPPLELIRAQMVTQALTVPDVATAQVFFSDITNRTLSGQVQVTSSAGVTTVAGF